LRKWREILHSDKSLSDAKKLEAVNRFFNSVPYVSDLEHWGKADYWATPIELLASNGGDCEDFAIAKYFTLRELGVPSERLRIAYVTALLMNQGQMKFQGHMVLTYFSSPDAEPLILDNLQEKILPASQRKDLAPVYSFNGDNLWLAKEMSGRSQPAAGGDRVSLWQEVQGRMRREAESRL
jgi:predicted transglutaminase-like cysteine proteinase